MSGQSLFCFGLGYSAGFLARTLAREGWRIAGTTRDAPPERAEFPLWRFCRGEPLGEGALLGATHILISVPPDEAGCPVLDEHGAAIAGQTPLAWVGYLSTTNVYGDHAGGWVDEHTPVAPAGARGKRRAAAEAAWLDLQRRCGVPVHVFRLAGIYGPGRSALDALKSGTARRVVKPGQVFSRIHVADLAAMLRASMTRPRPGAVYNVCDDEAAPPQDVVAHAASLMGVAPPPLEDFATAALSPMARSFYDENKRVSNRRIKDELGVRLRYPTYREGLAALLGEVP